MANIYNKDRLPIKYRPLPAHFRERIAVLLNQRLKILQRIKMAKRKSRRPFKKRIERAKVYAKYSPVKSRARITVERMRMKHLKPRIPRSYRQRLSEIDREVNRLLKNYEVYYSAS